MARRSSGALAFAALDLCACLILVIYTLIAPPTKVKVVSIPTQGLYAIVQNCPTSSQNDVDLYVQDPAGKIAYFNNTTAGLMHLEQDIIPGYNTVENGTKLKQGDDERTILRGTIPGTYVVNLHMYDGSLSPLPETCTVTLYSMRNGINVLTQQKVTLQRTGSAETAFEFVVNAKGEVTAIQHFPRDIVYGTAP